VSIRGKYVIESCFGRSALAAKVEFWSRRLDEKCMSKSENANPVEAAKRALKKQFKGEVVPDNKGYVKWPIENLIPGVELNDFEADLRGGSGDELRIKFCAVHSSAALAVNSFTYFKKCPQHLYLLGRTGFSKPIFERQCPTGLGGTPPNLDIWLESPTEVVAIESKFLEYFTQKEAKYAASYKREAVDSEDCWWDLLKQSKTKGKQYLDEAQLVKHYLGLRNFMGEQNVKQNVKKVTLLYLFWEPRNADSIDACKRHREEVEAIKDKVSGSQIQFEWTTYSRLWNEWNQIPQMTTHVANLRARYEVNI
jgi:hypothetical protein